MDETKARPRSSLRKRRPTSGGRHFLAWVVVASSMKVFRFELFQNLFVLVLLLDLALWTGFAALAVSAAVGCIRRRFRPSSVALLLAVGIGGVGVAQYGDALGIRLRFLALKPGYEADVASIAAGGPRENTARYWIEPGPPLRVVFRWPGGILDNWCGVVYDPSGLVSKARGILPDLSNFGDPAFVEVRGLFGGDLRSCRPLGGPWYFCCFT